MNRRGFLKKTVAGSAGAAMAMSVEERMLLAQADGATAGEKTVKPAEEMRPGEVLAAVSRGPYAFVPVSPTFEWHSFHLPMGTDALIPQEMARIMAGRVGGIWFRPLSFGLDAWRDPQEKKEWGIRDDEEVYGMNFPELPVWSEYSEKPEMVSAVKNRLKPLSRCGVKHAFLMNHHGGKGQFETIEELAKEYTNEKMKVHAIRTYQFNDLKEEDGFYGQGGHAGWSETTWLLAFRPELVDLDEQEEGELSVRKTGILHETPTIDAKWNPRRVSLSVADKLRQRAIANFEQYIRKVQTV